MGSVRSYVEAGRDASGIEDYQVLLVVAAHTIFPADRETWRPCIACKYVEKMLDVRC